MGSVDIRESFENNQAKIWRKGLLEIFKGFENNLAKFWRKITQIS